MRTALVLALALVACSSDPETRARAAPDAGAETSAAGAGGASNLDAGEEAAAGSAGAAGTGGIPSAGGQGGVSGTGGAPGGAGGTLPAGGTGGQGGTPSTGGTGGAPTGCPGECTESSYPWSVAAGEIEAQSCAICPDGATFNDGATGPSSLYCSPECGGVTPRQSINPSVCGVGVYYCGTAEGCEIHFRCKGPWCAATGKPCR
jgi:hypothetical protein